MKPVIAIIGRPNVGKSTLFNCLTRTRNALVADEPGITRDKQIGEGKVGERGYLAVDTGGITDTDDPLYARVAKTALTAAREADAVLFMVDGREGRNVEDDTLAKQLRPLAGKVQVVVNKTEGLDEDSACAEFHQYGLGDPVAVSSAHSFGMEELMAKVLDRLPPASGSLDIAEASGIRIAVLGRPNVGKSTLVNRMLGEERVLTFDAPGTTRDAIAIPFQRDGQDYVLIDTAGIRRRARVGEGIEKFSVIKALQAIEAAHVVILVMDASEGVTDQDASLIGQVLDAGRGLILALNKWDGLTEDQKIWARTTLDRRIDFIDFAKVHFISALHGTAVGNLFQSINRAYQSARVEVSSSDLTEMLEMLVEAHQPPMVSGRRIKLRYAHLGGKHPPVIVIHGNQTESLPSAYKRYLEKEYRRLLKLEGTPLKLEFRSGDNPFKDKRNTLTPRQVSTQKRLIRRSKKTIRKK